ncbi:hypothetical protein [Streptomyces sp. NPDC054863]
MSVSRNDGTDDRETYVYDGGRGASAQIEPDSSAPEEGGVSGEVTDLGSIPAQNTVTESPTVAVARDRLVEAIGREAAFLADQRAGQASQGLEALARAFALVSGSAGVLVEGVTAIPAQARAVPHKVGLCLELEPEGS